MYLLEDFPSGITKKQIVTKMANKTCLWVENRNKLTSKICLLFQRVPKGYIIWEPIFPPFNFFGEALHWFSNPSQFWYFWFQTHAQRQWLPIWHIWFIICMANIDRVIQIHKQQQKAKQKNMILIITYLKPVRLVNILTIWNLSPVYAILILTNNMCNTNLVYVILILTNNIGSTNLVYVIQ